MAGFHGLHACGQRIPMGRDSCENGTLMMPTNHSGNTDCARSISATAPAIGRRIFSVTIVGFRRCTFRREAPQHRCVRPNPATRWHTHLRANASCSVHWRHRCSKAARSRTHVAVNEHGGFAQFQYFKIPAHAKPRRHEKGQIPLGRWQIPTWSSTAFLRVFASSREPES